MSEQEAQADEELVEEIVEEQDIDSEEELDTAPEEKEEERNLKNQRLITIK